MARIPTPTRSSTPLIRTSSSPTAVSSYTATGNWNMLDTVLWNDNGVAAAYGGFTPQDHASFGYLDWSTQTWINRTDAQKTAEGDACAARPAVRRRAESERELYRRDLQDVPFELPTARTFSPWSSNDDGATWHTLAKSTWSTRHGWLYLDPSHVVGPNGRARRSLYGHHELYKRRRLLRSLTITSSPRPTTTTSQVSPSATPHSGHRHYAGRYGPTFIVFSTDFVRRMMASASVEGAA